MPRDFFPAGTAPKHMTGLVGHSHSTRRDFIRGNTSEEEKNPTRSAKSSSSNAGGQTSPDSSVTSEESTQPSAESSAETPPSLSSVSKWDDAKLNKFLRGYEYSREELEGMSRGRKRGIVKQILKEG